MTLILNNDNDDVKQVLDMKVTAAALDTAYQSSRAKRRFWNGFYRI